MHTNLLRALAALCLVCAITTTTAGNPALVVVTQNLLQRGGKWLAAETVSWAFGKAIDSVVGSSHEKELEAALGEVRSQIRTLEAGNTTRDRASSERDRLYLELNNANVQQLKKLEAAITTQMTILRRLLNGKVDRAEAEQRHGEIVNELQKLEQAQDATAARVQALEERIRRIERSGARVTDVTSTDAVIISRSPSRRDVRRARELARNGDRLLARGATREAVEAYDRALVLNRDLVDAYAGRARAHERLQSYDEALHDLRSAMSRDERRQDLVLIRAGIYRKLREYDKAVDDYTLFLSRAQHLHEKAFYGRGCAYVEGGKTAAAADDFRACVRIAPASREGRAAAELLQKLHER